MKKKLLITLLSLVCAFACAFALVACGGKDTDDKPPAHTHTYSDDWQSNASDHWHPATCEHTNEKDGVAAHIDENNDGQCDVCEYTPLTVKVAGTYYYCENDVTDDNMYIVFNNGTWTDDENETGEYIVSSNTVTLYTTIDDEKSTLRAAR